MSTLVGESLQDAAAEDGEGVGSPIPDYPDYNHAAILRNQISQLNTLLGGNMLKPGDRLRAIETMVKLQDRLDMRQSESSATDDLVAWCRDVLGSNTGADLPFSASPL